MVFFQTLKDKIQYIISIWKNICPQPHVSPIDTD